MKNRYIFGFLLVCFLFFNKNFAQICSPCSGGALIGGAITPTAGGACSNNIPIDGTTCTGSSSGVYGSACADKAMGSWYTTAYHTWLKITVPASGIVGIEILPDAGAELQLPVLRLFTSITCGAGTTISSGTFYDCSFENMGNCGGGYTCGDKGTLAYTANGPGGSTNYGSQSYWTGLTPGATIWALVDFHFLASGATSAYTGSYDICMYNGFRAGSNNWIAGSSTLCGGTVTGTTQSSIQGYSLCTGYKPPNCGGGPAPSFENVSIFKMTSDASGSDMTISLTGATCVRGGLGLQMLVYSAGTTSGCTGSTPICGSGTCTLGSCIGGNTASGLANKTLTITAPAPNTTYYVLVDGFSGSICDFSISSTGCVVLPITLLEFTAKKDGELVKLDWRTASEENNDYFIMERSFDGENFRTIQMIDGHGTTNETNDYGFYDNVGNYNGTIYYRLKQIDFDGKETFSVTQTVFFNNIFDQLSVRPNPAKESCNIQFNTKIGDETSDISIIDINGKEVLNFKHDNAPGLNTVSIDLSNFIHGVYMVKVSNNSSVINGKLVKTNN